MKVALQFFTVRNALKKDPEGTMRAVADLGYRYWETCSFNPDSEYNYGLDMPIGKAQSLLKELGVTIVGCHLMQQDLVPENRDALLRNLDYQAGIGCESPGLAAIFVPTLDDVKRCCDDMNVCAELCRERGMKFHFHNHWHEFAELEPGHYMLDYIMEWTDPSLVDMEIDTFWAARGGMDPVQTLYRYQDRLCMIHQKDISKKARNKKDFFYGRDRSQMVGDMGEWMQAIRGYEEDFAEVGTGIMDLQAIINAGVEIGAKYITLEQDYTTYPELESAKISLGHFKTYSGLDWT